MGVSVGAYNATLTINEFKGIMQFDENESMNTDMRFAADGKNFDTRDGSLLPIVAPVTVNTVAVGQEFRVKSATIFKRRRPYSGGLISLDATIFVAGVEQTNGDKVVYIGNLDGGNAVSVGKPGGGYFESAYWSFATYEMTPEGETEPVDILLMSNPDDGMFYIRNAGIVPVTTPANFGVIARHGERIWGAGIKDEPDAVWYSAPFDPLDWELNAEIPEDGAGVLRLASFDGERITALKSFGNSLVLFKETGVWRLVGLSPEEYQFQQQYGGGTIYPNTIATDQEKMFLLTDRGVCVYDGITVSPFQQYALRTFWRDANLREYIGEGESGEKGMDLYTPIGAMWNNQYILSIPGNGAVYNKHTIIYDVSEGAWHLSEDLLDAVAFLPTAERLTVISCTGYQATHSDINRWYESIEAVPGYLTTELPTVMRGFDWLTPWTDMGVKDVEKSEFKLRFWIQTHVNTASTSPITAAGKLKLSVTIETERGSKTRTILYDKDVDEEVKMRFHLTGRRVRMRIQATDGGGNESMNAWCKIMGGVQLNADTSQD